MISDLLPGWVASVEVTGSMAPEPLPAEESAALGRLVPKRRLEFTIGRQCAREALQLLGVPRQPILVGPSREPVWPSGIVGSITHIEGFCAAAVARRAQAASVGIDAEAHEALPRGVLASVASEDEREAFKVLPTKGVFWDRVLFSAKESAFKAWFPISRRWLGFDQVRLDIQPEAAEPVRGTFTAHLLGDELVVDGQAVKRLEGRYRVEGGRVLTAIVVPAGVPLQG